MRDSDASTNATQPPAGHQLSIHARIVRWIGRFAWIVALGAMLVFAGISVTHLSAWVTPPHYPPMSPAYTPPFSSSGISYVPIEGWTVLALAAVAWKVRGATAQWEGE